MVKVEFQSSSKLVHKSRSEEYVVTQEELLDGIYELVGYPHVGDEIFNEAGQSWMVSQVHWALGADKPPIVVVD